MQELFKAAIERGASDVHIKSGDVVRARVNGYLVPLTQKRLSAEQVKGIAMKLIPHEDDKKDFDKLLTTTAPGGCRASDGSASTS